MPAPVVQSLDQILADLAPAYSGQEAVIGQQQAALPAKYDVQTQGLEAAKTNTFRDINTGANRRGLAFSGIPIAEQTRYTGEKYLPALAGLKTQQNAENLTLAGQLASLSGEKRLRAIDTRSSQAKALQDWQNAEELRQEQEAFDRWKIANDQAFQTKLEGLKHTYALSESAANRAGSAGPSNQELFASELAKSAGKDGKVSPGTYNALKNQWVASGYGTYKDFHDRYWKFANASHWWDYK